MPSVSQNQQKLMGLVYAAKKGEIPVSALHGPARQIYEKMPKEKIREFAKTKRKGLPKKASLQSEVMRQMAIRIGGGSAVGGGLSYAGTLKNQWGRYKKKNPSATFKQFYSNRTRRNKNELKKSVGVGIRLGMLAGSFIPYNHAKLRGASYDGFRRAYQQYSGSPNIPKATIKKNLSTFGLKMKGVNSKSQVKQAYWATMRKVHPDKGGNEEIAKTINRAFDDVSKTDWFKKLAYPNILKMARGKSMHLLIEKKALCPWVLKEATKRWIQSANKSIKSRGTEGVCSGANFGGPT